MSLTAPKRPRNGLKTALAVLSVIGLTAAATSTAGLLEVQQFVDDLNTGEKLNLAPGVISSADVGKPQTILLLGSDHRFRTGKTDARSDTIMIVRLDADAAGTRIMNIPRDLKVTIPKYGTQKINASYAYGGPSLTAQVVKDLLGIPINHIVNVNFGGFHKAVDYIGCVWTDIDRRYFNDNSTAGSGGGYAKINIAAGYQKLCGSQSLDYVRFRHMDSDIVRGARQQDFIRQARQQYGAQSAMSNRHELAKIFSKYAQSDSQLHSVDALLKLLGLVAFSGQKPVISVPFPAILPSGPSNPYVTVNPAELRQAVHQLVGPSRPASKPAGSQAKKAKPRVTGVGKANVVANKEGARAQAALLRGIGMPVLLPKVVASGSRYMGPQAGKYPRAYLLRSPDGKKHVAYRVVLTTNGSGQFYGVQGTTWQDPPLLSQPTAEKTIKGGRKLLLFGDGKRLRFVGFKTKSGSYWVSNTLTEDLPSRTMIAIAASLVPFAR
ncbi:MAG: LCP family protein [Solirubrobacterales bacterium]|nr:LCP family protein [Solirubrobacterales bacterium]